jgi:tripartite-type tricarboxylate transporter receptor subunit TctC
MNRRQAILAAGATAASVILAGSPLRGLAQDASKVTRMIVGFPPGGSVDIVARLIADQLRLSLGGTFIVENVSGAGGRLAVQRVKASPADGSTILVTPGPMMTLYPHIFAKLAYDPAADFVPVTAICTLGFGLAVTSAVPATVKTVQDLVAWYKANPKQATYASGGAGTPMHFVGAMLAKHAGLELTHVAYKGATPMISDALGGQVPVAITTITDVLPHAISGRLRILAVTLPRRSSFLPDVPTFSEAGAKEIVVEDWFGMFVAAGTPMPVIIRLNNAVREALKVATVGESFAKWALEPAGAPQAQFAKTVESDTAIWGPVVKSTGFKIEE